MRSVAVLLLALIVASLAQEFTADVTISSTTLLGRLTGKFFYSATQKATRLTYTSGLDEVQKFDTQNLNTLFIYKKCPTKCDVTPQPLNVIMPVMYYESSDTCSNTPINAVFGSCLVCTKANTGSRIASVCIENMTTKKVIRATYTDGTVYDFNNVNTAAIPSTTFDIPAAWGCKLTCLSALDIVLVVDESNSVQGNYIPGVVDSGFWRDLRLFTSKFVKTFEIASDKVNMGLVQFSKFSIITSLPDPYITSDSVYFNTLVDGLTKNLCTTQVISGVNCKDPKNWAQCNSCRGRTYTGLGFIDAVDMLLNKDGVRALRKDVSKLIFLVTDGNDNNADPFSYKNKQWANPSGWVNYAKNNGITVITVGVGNVDVQYLSNIASKDVTGKAQFFKADSYSQLNSDSLINLLGRTVCSAAGTVPDACPKCRGQCVCGKCLCPDTCVSGDACLAGDCNATYNDAGGCLFQKKNCNDQNACTIDTCDTQKGCQYSNVACDDGKKCTTDICNPAVGCQATEKICTDANKCNLTSCDVNTGFCSSTDICKPGNNCTVPGSSPGTFVPIDCTGGDKCKLPDCDLAKGCLNKTKNCDDGNVCTNDKCGTDGFCVNDPINCNDNNACTVDGCDAIKGCTNETIDAPVVCNDGNNCTIDSCDTKLGCIHTNVTCNKTIDLPCLVAICDPIQGCLTVPKVCPAKNKCFLGFCENATGICKQKELDSCVNARLAAITTGAALGAGIIAAIVIAAVIFAGAAVGGAVALNQFVFKGEFTNTNQLYVPETQTVQNPIHENKNN